MLKILPIFICFIAVITCSLLNINLFFSETITAYYGYCLSASLLFCLILSLNDKVASSFNIANLFFFIWIIYIQIHGLIFNNYHTTHLFAIANLLFLFSSIHLSKTKKILELIFNGVIILMMVEIAFCLCQYFGWAKGLSEYFEVSGTWKNPNVTAMFLSMCLPIVFFKIRQNVIFKKAGWALIGCIMLVLVLLKCRSAFIGASVVCIIYLFYHFKLYHFFSNQRQKFTRNALLLFTAILLTPVSIKLYQAKQASADGRLFIWKVSKEMIFNKPIVGYGFGLFEKYYNPAQAAYIESGKATPLEMQNATHINMAYNEFLQTGVDGGFISIILFGGFLISLVCFPLLLKRAEQQLTEITLMAYAGVCAFLIMSLVNFTVQAIPAWAMLLFFAGILISNNTFKTLFTVNFKKPYSSLLLPFVLLFMVGIYTLADGDYHNKKLFEQRKAKVSAALLSQFNKLEASQKKYPNFYVNYATTLFYLKQYPASLKEIQKAKAISSETIVYELEANCYLKLGKPDKAIENFLYLHFLVPTKFAPLFNLMMISIKKKDTENAIKYARQIHLMKVKVPSAKVNFYKQQAKMYLLSMNVPTNQVNPFKTTKPKTFSLK